MTELHVVAGAELARAAAELRRVQETMRLEFETAMLEAADPIIAAARSNARATLPSRGGLAALVARSTFTVKPLRRRGSTGIRIETADHDKRLDTQGRLRHLVYGREPWVQQHVTPGWFTTAAKKSEQAVAQRMERAVLRVVDKIEGAA